MTTAVPPTAPRLPDGPGAELPAGVLRVRAGGLLASVRRLCPEHAAAGECPCVGRRPDEGCLVFWCAQGAHHFTAR